jgi:Raf kinase inhibitor-like YbhB/YbcL family protein
VVRGTALLLIIFLGACGGDGGDGADGIAPEGGGAINVTSTAFSEGATVPTEFTCEGANTSPPLAWSGVPQEAAELRLTVSDPDAPSGEFIHWRVTGIDAGSTGVEAGQVPPGGREEQTSAGEAGYAGPCPPRGDDPHRYIWTVEALDGGGQVLDSGSITTTFGR